MKTYIILFLLFICSGVNQLTAKDSVQIVNINETISNHLLVSFIAPNNSIDAKITSPHSKGADSNYPYADLTQVELEEVEDKLRSSIKKDAAKDFVFVSPITYIPTESNLFDSKAHDKQAIVTTEAVIYAAPLYIRIAVFRI